MILTNGRIYTIEARNRVVDTIVVREGRVAFVGRRADVNAPAAEEVVDLEGRAVLPGLVDAHGHLMYLARARLTLDAGGARSEAEVAERVAARAATLPPGEWLGGARRGPKPRAGPPGAAEAHARPPAAPSS